jgi:hypothetical protein
MISNECRDSDFSLRSLKALRDVLTVDLTRENVLDMEVGRKLAAVVAMRAKEMYKLGIFPEEYVADFDPMDDSLLEQNNLTVNREALLRIGDKQHLERNFRSSYFVKPDGQIVCRKEAQLFATYNGKRIYERIITSSETLPPEIDLKGASSEALLTMEEVVAQAVYNVRYIILK